MYPKWQKKSISIYTYNYYNDWWAIGCIIYFLFTNDIIFKNIDINENVRNEYIKEGIIK